MATSGFVSGGGEETLFVRYIDIAIFASSVGTIGARVHANRLPCFVTVATLPKLYGAAGLDP